MSENRVDKTKKSPLERDLNQLKGAFKSFESGLLQSGTKNQSDQTELSYIRAVLGHIDNKLGQFASAQEGGRQLQLSELESMRDAIKAVLSDYKKNLTNLSPNQQTMVDAPLQRLDQDLNSQFLSKHLTTAQASMKNGVASGNDIPKSETSKSSSAILSALKTVFKTLPSLPSLFSKKPEQPSEKSTSEIRKKPGSRP